MANDLRLSAPEEGGRENLLSGGRRQRSPRQTKLLHIFEMVVLTALGFWLILHPYQSLKTAVRLLGVALLVSGGLAIGFFAFSKQKSDLRTVGILILGSVAAVLGLVVLIKPGWVIAVFPMAAGIFVAFNGILNTLHALQTRKAGSRGWQILLVLSLLSIVVGILLFANPFAYMSTLVILLGAVLIYNGILGILAAAQE